jgi:putative PIN family toxin of toxin-antitoxin system
MLRLVLDTNIWLDLLVFRDPGIAAICEAHAARRAEILADADGEAELARALSYNFGKHTLDEGRQAARLAEFRQMSVHVKSKRAAGGTATLPLCRDPDDQKFLETALAVHADILITKDRALLDLARRVPFRILTPAAFAELGANAPYP